MLGSWTAWRGELAHTHWVEAGHEEPECKGGVLADTCMQESYTARVRARHRGIGTEEDTPAARLATADLESTRHFTEHRDSGA
jgi:hypothetical protein